MHDKIIEDSEKEKYVGDIISRNGKPDENIAARRSKGFGIASDILSILDEVLIGSQRIEAGPCMREGMLLNGILTNSEVWIGLNENHYRELEQVDEYLLRRILNSSIDDGQAQFLPFLREIAIFRTCALAYLFVL